jgi:phenylacetic acid degradation operon negative regulatory protein
MTDRLLPRDQQGARSQQRLTVLLGDYWHLRPEPLPSAALVELLSLFDVTPAGARAAIQRLARRGFLVPVRDGRTTRYAVSPMSRDSVDAHVRLLFQSHVGQEWDGTWTVLTYSLPEERRGTRNLLREHLRQARFGTLHDALWLRPGDAASVVDGIRRSLGDAIADDRLAVFVGARLPSPAQAELVRQAFGLDRVAAAYRDFIDEWGPVARQIERGSGDADGQALQRRTSVMRDWRELRHADPMLPREVLGESFPFDEALAVCSAVYDTLGAPAEATFRRVIERHAPELARFASHHTFAGYGAAPPPVS